PICLLSTDATGLLALPGLGQAKACEILAISELARRALEEDLQAGASLDQPGRVKQYCTARLAHLNIEHCMALYLDSRFRLIVCEEVSRRSEEHTSELQSREKLVCRLLLEKKKGLKGKF